MAEFLHTFRGGKMNKDVDERLIPEGQYRDALNLEISTSEGSDTGALQNIKGNTEIINKAYSANTNSFTEWSSDYIDSLTNAYCIGSFVDTITNKIYWFVASNEASVIAEFITATKVIRPLLVENKTVSNNLNFSKDYLITGVSVIDNVLYWTDNQKEPKRLNIGDFQNSTTDFITHSKIYNRDFLEEDITVIKKSPLEAPSLDMHASVVGGPGTGITPVTTEYTVTDRENFTYIPTNNDPVDYVSMPTYAEAQSNPSEYPSGITGQVTINVSDAPTWAAGSIVNLSGSYVGDYNQEMEFGIRAEVVSGSGTTSITINILSISQDINKTYDDLDNIQPIEWEVLLEEDMPMFEFRFVRFAYRWKYKDNQFSTFSPWTKPAFLGNEFKYVSSDAYNIGMTNNIRKLDILDLEWGNDDVKEIEVLYKESISTAVYLVDTIDDKTITSLSINSEIIGAVVEANQIIRPWDNVPRKAQALEITKNRIIYGNYLQNYNVPAVIDISVDKQTLDHPGVTDESLLRMPYDSIKSLRTYQAGLLYLDKYGRETPVFTNNNASIAIPKSDAASVTSLKFISNHAPPAWATHFKYFIKETSNEYYNLALDRYYDAEDGNVWLSFPSSERNKITDDTYLVLKKQHDTDIYVAEDARYKVLAIENEAPEYIATFNRAVAFARVTTVTGFEPDFLRIEFDGPTGAGNNDPFQEAFTSEHLISVRFGSARTEDYRIASGGPTGVGSRYEVLLDTPFGEDANFLSDVPAGAKVNINVFKEVKENKPEFQGRFFVKINRDFAFEENVIKPFDAMEKVYGVLGEQRINVFKQSTNTEGNGNKFGWNYQDPGEDDDPWFECCGDNFSKEKVMGFGAWGGNGVWKSENTKAWYNPPTNGESSFGFGCAGVSGSSYLGPLAGDVGQNNGLMQPGVLVRFIDNRNGDKSNVYGVTDVEAYRSRRGKMRTCGWFPCTNCCPDSDNGNHMYSISVLLDSALGPNGNIDFFAKFNGDRNSLDNAFGGSLPRIQVLEEAIGEGNKRLTSTNPAIFETEPKEAIDLDLYYQATGAIPINQHGVEFTLDWHNCYSYGNGVESNRIRDDYNQPTIDKGPIVSAPLDEPYGEERKSNGLIYSGIYNGNANINNLNQFIQGLKITKDLNPIYGPIRKLYTRDTDLVTFCEDKVLKILANKDALFNADGNTNLTSTNNVLGQTTPFAGEFGISKQPESFAKFGYRAYFTDQARGAVLRLSRDGIEEISRYGMSDFFSDNLIANERIIGSYDITAGEYNVTLNDLTEEWQDKLSVRVFDRLNEDPDCPEPVVVSPTTKTTVSFAEGVNGWSSRKTFIPENGVYLNDNYYTFKSGLLWHHKSNEAYNNFYGLGPQSSVGKFYESSVDLIINDQSPVVKGFKTLNYSGTRSLEYVYSLNNIEKVYKEYSIAEIIAQGLIPTGVTTRQGWYANSVYTDLQEGRIKEFITKEGKHFNYIKGLPTFFNDNCDTNVKTPEFSVQGIGRATQLTGDTEPTAYYLNVCIDPTCYEEEELPNVVDQFYEGTEDVVLNIQLQGPTNCSQSVTYSLVLDSTSGGSLTLNSNGSFSFNPDLNFYGQAGTFVVEACCGSICNTFTVTLAFLEVPEDPYFVSPAPSPSLSAGDCFTYNPIILADPDHEAVDLIIQTPVPNLPAWMLQPEPLNDGTGNWYIPNSCVPEGTSPGTIDFTMTVEDPDGNTGTQQVVGDTLAAAIANLEFLVTTRSAQVARSWNNPNPDVPVVQMSAIGTSGHGCARGTYRLTGNGVTFARVYVGNNGGATNNSSLPIYDTFTVDSNGNANSRTGDVEWNGVIPSAVAQGVTSTLLSNQATQKYITPSDSFAGSDRYNLVTIDIETAQDIIANSPDPNNPNYIVFGLVPDTWIANGTLDTHGDGVSMQIFKEEVEVYSAVQPNNSALTLDVLTGDIIP
jgi:hypothetical protein